MKPVILGVGGQLGNALTTVLPDAWALDRAALDIADDEAVADFDWGDRDTIINAAAYTNVDGAETPDGSKAAYRANVHGVVNLAQAAQQYDLTLAHVSSEYVFDGTADRPMPEDWPMAPLGVYGKSKAAGDVVAGLVPRHYIVRTSWVVGNGGNFVRTMTTLAARGVRPAVVGDQIGRLTFADDLARGICHLLENEAPYGTYNLTGDGDSASWAEVARLVYTLSGRNPDDVHEVTSAEYFGYKPAAAPRPLSSVLDLSKIKATGFAPRDWRESLAELFN